MPLDRQVLPLLAGLLVLAGCATKPTERVVLLPSPEGVVGEVSVTQIDGEHKAVRLKDAYATAAASKRDVVAQVSTRDEVSARYGRLLNGLPVRPRVVTLYFIEGKDELTMESGKTLEEIKALLASQPVADITIVGHTDTIGSQKSNDELSLKRALSIRTQLVQAGADANRIAAAGRGERELLVPTADEVVEPRNRRVEVTIR